ncbi:MAG: hypothetical protein KF850_23765 [Labilithrix sp.]|nr:hypothetical protein [Labilithrix sp.]
MSTTADDRDNVIASCSDVGVYINRGKDTRSCTTLIATSGVDFRFDTSSGESAAILTGVVRDRNGSTHTAANDLPNVARDSGMYRAAARPGTTRMKGRRGRLS